MHLNEFITEQKQLMDDFAYHYLKHNSKTMFHSSETWNEMLADFLSNRSYESADRG